MTLISFSWSSCDLECNFWRWDISSVSSEKKFLFFVVVVLNRLL